MSAAGACDACGAPLAADQRYCLSCGARAGALRYPGEAPIVIEPPPSRTFKVPAPRTAAAVAATTLGFGIFVGVVIGPSLSGTSLATGPLSLVLPAPASAPTAHTAPGHGGVAPTLSSPVASRAAPAPPSAPVQAAATAPAPVAPAPTTATAPPSEPAGSGGGGGGGRGGGGEPVAPTGATIDGTVVHQNPTAGTYAVATKTRQLFGVHAGRLADAGAVLSAPVGSLFNGTFAQTGKPDESGTATEARFAGTVSYVDPASPAYAVSVRGVSALVHVPSDGLAPPDLPAVGDDVVVTASIEAVPGPGPGGAGSPPATTTGPTGTTTAPTTTTTTQPPAGCAPSSAPVPEGIDSSLVEKTRKDSGPTTFLYLAGRVEATCPDSSQLALSADDAGESGAALTLAVADGIDLTKVEVGDPLIADAEIGDDGAMTVTGLASDDGAKGADDPSTAQGDLASSKRAAPGRRARRARSTVVAGFHEKLTRKHRTVNGIGGPRP